MENREYILELYLLYKNLLNDREREYFEDYYFEDYSLNEIAFNNKVSKSYVGKIINKNIKKLEDFENKLSIYDRNKKIKEIISFLDEETKSKIDILL